MLMRMLGGLIRTHKLEARLRGVGEREYKGPRAEVDFIGWAKGRYRLRIETEDYDYIFAQHVTLDVIVEGETSGEGTVVGEVPLRPGKRRTRFERTHRDGPLGFMPAVGQMIALGQDGVVIVSGRFRVDD